MFDSLRARLFGSHLIVGGLVLALSAISLSLLVVRNPTVDRFVYQRLEAILQVVVDPPQQGRPGISDRRSLDRTLSVLGRPLGARALVYGEGMELRYDSAPALPAPPMAQVPQDGSTDQPARGSYVDETGRTWLIVAMPFGDLGRLAVSAPRPGVTTFAMLLSDVAGPLLQTALVALVLSLLLSYVVARWVGRPLQRLVGAARSVARGQLDVSLPHNGPREVRELAAAFEEMVANVEASRRAQRDFVANVSHELKTPLTSIQGYAQAIKDGTAAAEADRSRAAAVIHSESLRMRRLVDDLLDLARLDSGQFELQLAPLDPGPLLAEVLEGLRPQAQSKEIRLESSLKDLPRITADGDRLRQVFVNLLANALEHTPRGGRVLLAAEADQEQLLVWVADSGPGIARAQRARVFERFYQLDEARASSPERGAGLGLSIAQELVRAHGGEIRLDRSDEGGARFTVSLPLSHPDDRTVTRHRG